MPSAHLGRDPPDQREMRSTARCRLARPSWRLEGADLPGIDWALGDGLFECGRARGSWSYSDLSPFVQRERVGRVLSVWGR